MIVREGIHQHIKDEYGQYTYDVLVGKFIHLSNQFKDMFALTEWHMYGSSRLGVHKPAPVMLSGAEEGAGRELVHIEFEGTWNQYTESFDDTSNTTTTTYQMSYDYFTLTRGEKNYEMVNHLGNVLVIISDKKLKTCEGDTVNYYMADVLQATDYSAFHATLKDRVWYADAVNKYRFGGSNGQERDDEVFVGAYTAEYWEYDSRLGRRWNVDPEISNFQWQSPYATFDNNPILIKDPKGLSGEIVNKEDPKKHNRENKRFQRLSRRLERKYKDDYTKYMFELTKRASHPRYGSKSTVNLEDFDQKQDGAITITGRPFQPGYDNTKSEFYSKSSYISGGVMDPASAPFGIEGQAANLKENIEITFDNIFNGQTIFVEATTLGGFRVEVLIDGNVIASFKDAPQTPLKEGENPDYAIHKKQSQLLPITINTGNNQPQQVVISFRTVYTKTGATVHRTGYPLPMKISEIKVGRLLPAADASNSIQR